MVKRMTELVGEWTSMRKRSWLTRGKWKNRKIAPLRKIVSLLLVTKKIKTMKRSLPRY